MRHRKLLLAALVVLALLGVTDLRGFQNPAARGASSLEGLMEPVSAQGAPLEKPPTGTVLRGGAYVLEAGDATCQAALTGFRKPVRASAIASGGAYRLSASAPADTSGCCCKGYLPTLRR